MWDKALKINSNNAHAWYNKGFAINNLERYEKAIYCFDKALAINPKYAQAWRHKAYALNNLGRYEEAIYNFERAIENDPTNPNAWGHKGFALNILQRYEEAIKCFDGALKIDSKNPINNWYWYLKGEALFKLKKYEEAIWCVEKALEISPTYEEALNLKSRVKEKIREQQVPTIERETEFFNGFIRLKMAVTNPMSQIITDVSLDLDFDEHTLRLDRHEPDYPVKKGKIQLGTINPGTGKTVSFYLDPMTCTKAGTGINCRVDYRDAYGKPDSIRMENKKIKVVCPIFRTESDINLGMLKEFIENLPYHDSKVYQIPTGLQTNKLIEICRETIQMHDVRHIRTLRTKDDKTCETWYYGKTKVAENNIVIKASINEETKSIEIFAATPAPESLTGLLAELGHNLTKKIKEIGKKPAQIVNVSIKDTIIQRSPNLLNLCDMNGVCSEENIIVEDSVIQGSSIGRVGNKVKP